MHGRTDSHRDNSAHLRVLEFFFHCEAHQDVFNTLYYYKNTKNKQANSNNKNSIEIAIFKFTDLICFSIMGQLTAFFSRGFCLCMALSVGVTETMNTTTIPML